MSTVAEELEGLYLHSNSSDDSENWLLRSEVINEEILDIMVETTMVFLSLPPLLSSVAVLDAWRQAFDRLFSIVKGLKPIFEEEDEDQNRTFEGRPGRIYLSVEEEYFLACFFQEFYEMLSSSKILGVLDTGGSFLEPAEELISVYTYVRDVRESQEQNRKSRRRPSHADNGSRGTKQFMDKDTAYAEIKVFLDKTVESHKEAGPFPHELLQLAQAIDQAEETGVTRFIRTFRKQDFARLFRPIQGTELEAPFIQAVSKYYIEFLAEGHLFNAPTYETIMKETMRLRMRNVS